MNAINNQGPLNKNSSIEEIRAYVKAIEQKGKIPKENRTQSSVQNSQKQCENRKAESKQEKQEVNSELEELDKLKTKVLKYIMYKKRTEKEVRTKFSSSDVNKNRLEDVIEELKENGYIDDENYIARAVNEFVAINTLSLKEMRNKLYAKGLSNDIIEEYFSKNTERLQEYEQNNAKKIVAKKQSQMEKEEIEKFLYRKGYSSENIKNAF